MAKKPSGFTLCVGVAQLWIWTPNLGGLPQNFKNILIELLQRITPTTEEIKLYREYAASKKDPEKLTEEARYILFIQEVLPNFQCINTGIYNSRYFQQFPNNFKRFPS